MSFRRDFRKHAWAGIFGFLVMPLAFAAHGERLTSELTHFSIDPQWDLGADVKVTGGDLLIDFRKSQVSMILLPSRVCPPEAPCSPETLPAIQIELPIESVVHDEQGEGYTVTAMREFSEGEGPRQQLTIRHDPKAAFFQNNATAITYQTEVTGSAGPPVSTFSEIWGTKLIDPDHPYGH